MRTLTSILIFSFLISQASAAEKLQCQDSELTNKSCQLESNGFQIGIKDDNLLVKSGGKIKLYEAPYQASLSTWTNVEIKKIKTQTLFEFTTWDMPGSGGQRLMQSFYTMNDSGLVKVSSKTIQLKSWNREKASFVLSPLQSPKIDVSPQGQLVIKY